MRKPFYFVLGAAVMGVLVFSETVLFKAEIPQGLSPGSIHGSRRNHLLPFSDQDFQKNPALGRSVLLGQEAFYQTKRLAPDLVGNELACTSCHVGGGKIEGMLGLLGVAGKYPAMDPRQEKLISLSERVQSCFLRSLNGKSPTENDRILKALVDYLQALSPPGLRPWPGMDFVTLKKEELLPIASLDPKRGQALYGKQCLACHGADGQGEGWAPPLWGPQSYNDGAGLARIYPLASFLKDSMPFSDPSSLSAEEAQQLAAYLDSQERPHFSGLEKDYPNGKIPVDAVYDPRRYPQNPLH